METNMVRLDEIMETEQFEKMRKMDPVLARFIEQDEHEAIRKDVFGFIGENIERIRRMPDELNIEASLKALLKMKEVSKDWYEWFLDYYEQPENTIDIDYMCLTIEMAVKDKGINLDTFKKFVREAKDETVLIDAVDGFMSTSKDEKNDVQQTNLGSFDIENTDKRKEMLPSATSTVDGNNSERYGYSEMFENLLTVMTYKNRDEQNLSGIQSDLNIILTKFQVASTELNNFAMEIFRAWEKDKDEIHKLKSLCEIQKKLLSNQQDKLDDYKNEISCLRNRLAEAEKKEIKRENLSHKIMEIQGLMNELDGKEVRYDGDF